MANLALVQRASRWLTSLLIESPFRDMHRRRSRCSPKLGMDSVISKERKGLLGLLALFSTINFSLAFTVILLTPLVLSFASPATLGTVLSMGGIGWMIGGTIMVGWGWSQAPHCWHPQLWSAHRIVRCTSGAEIFRHID